MLRRRRPRIRLSEDDFDVLTAGRTLCDKSGEVLCLRRARVLICLGLLACLLALVGVRTRSSLAPSRAKLAGKAKMKACDGIVLCPFHLVSCFYRIKIMTPPPPSSPPPPSPLQSVILYIYL